MAWYGLDISNHQRNVDMKRVSDSVDFVIHKATEATGFVDRYWSDRRAAARSVNLPFGGYHFSRPDRNGWKPEVDHFMSQLDGKETIPPVLDWEHTAGIQKLGKAGATSWVLNFMNALEEEYGVTPILYTGYYIARDMMTNDKALGRYPLWIAWYASGNSHATNQAKLESGFKPPVPPQWESHSMWQYSSLGNVAGISPVDTNIAYVQPWNIDVVTPPPVVEPVPEPGVRDYDGYLEQILPSPGAVRVTGWAVDPKDLSKPADVRVIVDGKVIKTFKADVPDKTGRIVKARPEYKDAADHILFAESIEVDPGKHQIAVHVQKSDGKWWNLHQSPQNGILVPADAPPPADEPDDEPFPDDDEASALKNLRYRNSKMKEIVKTMGEAYSQLNWHVEKSDERIKVLEERLGG